jgi:hypothetical protein
MGKKEQQEEAKKLLQFVNISASPSSSEMRKEMRKLSAIRNRKIKHYLALNHALQLLLCVSAARAMKTFRVATLMTSLSS